ncbi:NAD(P)H:quinone type IV [Brachionus plicatilis]|uniref:NAD(P)H:quinone type IV n=1 Tax=Brachionus plicatilis TaxID=10195 RepID=A0A3M7T697_BRAPC|nr:NAD(P)H:quinone type IV [Brachionus plicatilis]
MSDRKIVFVVYYSIYGHVYEMAKAVCTGLEKSGVKAQIFQFEETLSENVLQKMKAKTRDESVPIITADKLVEADGILFGFPTHFGTVPSQVKNFFDSCEDLWLKSALSNKFVGTFFSSSSIGQGQESTTFTCIPFFVHMGMMYVSIGSKHRLLQDNSVVHGGSAFGAGCIALSSKPSCLELELAEFQGQDFGRIVLSYGKKIPEKKSKICNVI